MNFRPEKRGVLRQFFKKRGVLKHLGTFLLKKVSLGSDILRKHRRNAGRKESNKTRHFDNFSDFHRGFQASSNWIRKHKNSAVHFHGFVPPWFKTRVCTGPLQTLETRVDDAGNEGGFVLDSNIRSRIK
jgi:hypothetical protein